MDAATLTGAIGIALGHYNIGAFTNDQDLLNKFLAASVSAGKRPGNCRWMKNTKST